MGGRSGWRQIHTLRRSVSMAMSLGKADDKAALAAVSGDAYSCIVPEELAGVTGSDRSSGKKMSLADVRAIYVPIDLHTYSGVQPRLRTASRNTGKWGNPFIGDRIIVRQRTVFSRPTVHCPPLGHGRDLCPVG